MRNTLYKLTLFVSLAALFGSCKEDVYYGNWRSISTLTAKGRADASAFVIGDKAYMVGGYGFYFVPTYFNATWAFDTEDFSWSECDTLPGAPRRAGVAFTIDGKGYYASNKVPDVNGGSKGGGEYDTVNPWLVVLAHEDWYRDIVKSTWTRAYDSGVFERTCQLITDESGKYQGDFTKNYDKWNNIINNEIFAAELSAPAKECTNEAEAAAFLHDWLEKRVDFLNSQWHS